MSVKLTTPTTAPDGITRRPCELCDRAACFSAAAGSAATNGQGHSHASRRAGPGGPSSASNGGCSPHGRAATVLVTDLDWVTPDVFARGFVIGVGVTATLAAIALLNTQATGTHN